MARLGGWLAWALLLCGCPPAPPPPHPHPPPAPAPVPEPSATVDPPEPEPALDGYGSAFLRAYLADQRLPEQTKIYGPGEVADMQHWVVQIEPARQPYRYLTVGFGRRDQLNAYGTTPHRVELIAVIDPSQDADVVNVLSRLGGWMHDTARDPSERFKAFHTLRSNEPLSGMLYFVLIPAGEVTLFERDTITVLRVVPLAEEEYSHLKMRGDGAARAWWYRHRGDPALARRWSSAVPIPYVPE